MKKNNLFLVAILPFFLEFRIFFVKLEKFKYFTLFFLLYFYNTFFIRIKKIGYNPIPNYLFYKSQNANKKTSFIENRITLVIDDLEKSEQRLKAFNEQNRQILSPSLKLEEERNKREVDVQKEIYLTLKLQLELAKIELVQESSIIQILDKPQIPQGPFNINFESEKPKDSSTVLKIFFTKSNFS